VLATSAEIAFLEGVLGLGGILTGLGSGIGSNVLIFSKCCFVISLGCAIAS
jgi:uncharacterized membrane protein YtjA (UPF0391 family)